MKCLICNNNGECINDENSPLYVDNSDYLFVILINTINRGQL